MDKHDGIKFWKMAPPPNGRQPDVPTTSCEAELITRQKIFQLKFQYFLSMMRTLLYIPKFPVPKVVGEDGTVLDV